MEWLAIGLSILSLIVAVIGVVVAMKGNATQEQKRLEDKQSAEAALEEAKRQWEEGGSAIVVTGDVYSRTNDRDEDRARFVVSNTGRLATYVRSALLTDLGRISFHHLLTADEGPIRLEPGEPIELLVRRGDLSGRWVAQDSWFESCMVEIETGDGRIFRWNPQHGMDPDYAKF
jgi:hypothetical protein